MNDEAAGQAFLLAVRCLQSGQLGEAERLYRQLLAHSPGHQGALHHLGLIARRRGQPAAAVERMRRAVAVAPAQADIHTNLGLALASAQAQGAALACHRRALLLDPSLVTATHNYGLALAAVGAADAAVRAQERALALVPTFAEALAARGMALLSLGTTEAAVGALSRAVRVQPGAVPFRVALGDAHRQAGRPAVAATAQRMALILTPALPAALRGLGVATAEGGRAAGDAAATTLLRRCLRVDPQAHEAMADLSLCLAGEGREEEAHAGYRRALALAPTVLDTLHNLGAALVAAGWAHEAVAAFRRAVTLNPARWTSRLALGGTLLQAGAYREGWDGYEARLENRTLYPRQPPAARWRGGEVAGKTVLLWAEQGFGDTIQFLRYVPLLAARGASVVLHVQPEIVPLLGGLPGVGRVVGPGEPLPPIDLHVPLASLPGAFGTTLDSIPPAPYLRADPVRRSRWAARLGSAGGGLRVGLVWAGKPSFQHDALRSPRLDALLPLFAVPGIRVFGLQLGDGRRDLAGRAMPAHFTDLGPEIADFADTAAIMESLDLVISSCTAPAHLAGALGRPVWILLPFAADWRWLERRSDSPWYPSARLFRQQSPRDWGPPVAAMREELARLG